MKYIITSYEAKTSAKGTSYARLGIRDEKGTILTNVAMFKGFSGLEVGSIIDGTIEIKDYNGKPSYTLVAGNMGPKPAWVKTQKNDIKEAMERKSDGIQISSTFRDATSIMIALMGTTKVSPDDFKTGWLKWREWLVSNYESVDGVDKTLTSDGTPVPF